jgi:hypothetical protein
MSSRAILSYGLYVVPFAFVVGLSLQEWQLAQRVRAMEDGQVVAAMGGYGIYRRYLRSLAPRYLRSPPPPPHSHLAAARR